jgi:hypothetical protein
MHGCLQWADAASATDPPYMQCVYSLKRPWKEPWKPLCLQLATDKQTSARNSTKTAHMDAKAPLLNNPNRDLPST